MRILHTSHNTMLFQHFPAIGAVLSIKLAQDFFPISAVQWLYALPLCYNSTQALRTLGGNSACK